MDVITVTDCQFVVGAGPSEICFEQSVANGALVIGSVVMIMGLGGAYYALNHSYYDVLGCLVFTGFAAGLVYLFQ